MNIKLNQEVLVVGIGNCARYSTPTYKAIVSKIGRRWFEVDTGNHVGEREKFSLENGKSDGKGYMSEWTVYESENIFKNEKCTVIIYEDRYDIEYYSEDFMEHMMYSTESLLIPSLLGTLLWQGFIDKDFKK